MNKELTYVMIKPDGVQKNLFSTICNIFLQNDLDIIEIQNERLLSKELVREHYAHLLDKPFYSDLERFMLSGPVIPMIICGEDAVNKVRNLIGPTNVKKAQLESPNSIRALYGNPDFGPSNVIHASDSKENALIEIKRFFGKDMTHPCDCDRPKCLFKGMIL